MRGELLLKVAFAYRPERNKGASDVFVQEKSVLGSTKSLRPKGKGVEGELKEQLVRSHILVILSKENTFI